VLVDKNLKLRHNKELAFKAAFRLASFWSKFFCTRKLVQENLRKFHVHTTQVFCSRKWLYPLEKSDLQSIVQSAAEFHDRNLIVWNRTCSIRASFWRQFLVSEKWRQKPRSHRQVFCRKKLAPETCQSERGLNLDGLNKNLSKLSAEMLRRGILNSHNDFV